MTSQGPKKIQYFYANWGPMAMLWVAGVIEALMLARLLARLLAARPDSPAFMLLYAITRPLVAPLRALDAHQPSFGAVLELSTLLVAISVPLLTGAVWLWVARRNKASSSDVLASKALSGRKL